MEQEAIICQLKWSIQALSMEADAQLTCFPDFVVVTDELLLEYDHWYKVAIGNFPEYFTEEQTNILMEIENYFKEIPSEDMNMTIAEELKTSSFWKELRIIAKVALSKFTWNSEIPPDDRAAYIRG